MSGFHPQGKRPLQERLPLRVLTPSHVQPAPALEWFRRVGVFQAQRALQHGEGAAVQLLDHDGGAPRRESEVPVQRGDVEARPVGELEIQVPVGDGEDAADEVFAHAEQLILSIGAPFVPQKHEGVIYIRPPVG